MARCVNVPIFNVFYLQYLVTQRCINVFRVWVQGPQPNARVVYIDGAFDLFHAGHVEVCLHLAFFTFMTNYIAPLTIIY